MSVIHRGLSWLKPEVREYLLRGPEVLAEQGLIFSQDYCEINHQDLTLTKDQMIELQKSIQNPKLTDRVIVGEKGFTVDTILTIKIKELQKKTDALAAWTPLRNFFWKATVLTASSVAVLITIAFQSIPTFFVIAAAVGVVAGAVFTGIAAARYLAAQKQVDAWENPGNHLALERTAAFERSFPDILHTKTYDLGGLLFKEIQPHYGVYVKLLAQNLLSLQCTTPEQHYQWLENFMHLTPHPLDGEILAKLFGAAHQEYGKAFAQLEALQCVVLTRTLKPIFKVLGELKKEKYSRIEEFIPQYLEAIGEHYRQEAAKLKTTVLQDPVFLSKAYGAARQLLQQACATIVDSKQGVASVDIAALGARPPAFHPISQDVVISSSDAAYKAFIEEVKRRRT